MKLSSQTLRHNDNKRDRSNYSSAIINAITTDQSKLKSPKNVVNETREAKAKVSMKEKIQSGQEKIMKIYSSRLFPGKRLVFKACKFLHNAGFRVTRQEVRGDNGETSNTLSLDEKKIEKKIVKQENFLMGLKIDFEFSKILFRISLYKNFIKGFPL